MPEFRRLLIFSNHPSFFNNVFEKCKEPFVDQWDYYIKESWRVLVRKIFQSVNVSSQNHHSGFCDPTAWTSSTSKLLAAGADVHQRVNGTVLGYSTALHVALNGLDLPIDAFNRGYSWLEILEKCGVDIDAYLCREWEITSSEMEQEEHHSLNDISGLSRWSQLEEMLKLLRGPHSVWGGRHPSGGLVSEIETSDLMQVMPHFSYDSDNWRSVLPEERNCHKAWKQHYQDSWPITELIDRASTPCYYYSSHHLVREDTGSFKAFEKACHLVETRFERRQVKKWRKLQKKRGLTETNRQQIPGAWHEEWWETPMAL